jgi:uncharacterized RDD family membrane protein YckC
MSNENPYQSPAAPISIPQGADGYTDASKGKRFLNALIDGILFQIIAVVVGLVLGASGKVTAEDLAAAERSPLLLNLVSILVWVAYYVAMESTTGATVGKMLTGTRVIAADGSKPTMKQIIGRSFARLIPFEAFSFLGSKPNGWHDTLSKTRVVLK